MNCQESARKLLGNCQKIARKLPENCLKLPGNFQEIAQETNIDLYDILDELKFQRKEEISTYGENPADPICSRFVFVRFLAKINVISAPRSFLLSRKLSIRCFSGSGNLSCRIQQVAAKKCRILLRGLWE